MIRKIGICRERKNRWERRVPLVPEDVRRLVGEHGYEVVVQGSPLRVHSNAEYAAAGALIDDGIAGCDLVLSMSEPAAELIRPGGTYLYFGRTAPGQSLGDAFLRRLQGLGCTLFDGNAITDERGRNIIYIGRYIGLAGMIDTLWALGQRLKHEGYDTSFAAIRQAHQYENLASARRAIIDIAEELRDRRLPSVLRPLVFGFVGNDGISRGAQEIFDLLPHREITPSELLAGSVCGGGNEILKVVFPEEQTIRLARGGKWAGGARMAQSSRTRPKDEPNRVNLTEFYRHPKHFESDFGRYLRHLSVLVNSLPRATDAASLVAKTDIEELWKGSGNPRLRVIGDLSGTVEGAVEIASVATLPDAPVYVYEPNADDIAYGVDGHGPVIVSLADPACELPEEVSAGISHALMPLIQNLANVELEAPIEKSGLPMSLRRAVVLWRGRLTPACGHLRNFLKGATSEEETEGEASSAFRAFKNAPGVGVSGKNILILGGGSLARPLVHYLLEKTRHEVVCADQTLGMAAGLIKGYPRGKAVATELDNRHELERLIRCADFVVSLVPYRYHIPIAELCITHRKHMVTTSYIGEAMRELDGRARDAGIMLLNEMGVIPGIDHMIAMRSIHRVVANGGKVAALRMYGGALPAPEAGMNPLGYRYSWGMRCVLDAGRIHARYRDRGEIIDVSGPDVFRHLSLVAVPGLGKFEAYPCRNVIAYEDVYGLTDVKTLFRGTLRNPGWCSFWDKMFSLGWSSDMPRVGLEGKTWGQIMRVLVPGNGDLAADLCSCWNVPRGAAEIRCAEWLGLLGDEKVPAGPNNLLDLLCDHLQRKLAYRSGERDMILMHHELVAEYPDRLERITSTLIDYGVPNGDLAVTRTVGLPIAIFLKVFFEGMIQGLSGVLMPTIPAVYRPILEELESIGIRMTEHVEAVKTA